jgi:transposase-like protein
MSRAEDNLLKHLKGRGLAGALLIISDACLGFSESASGVRDRQRCIVRWYRNIFSHVLDQGHFGGVRKGLAE